MKIWIGRKEMPRGDVRYFSFESEHLCLFVTQTKPQRPRVVVWFGCPTYREGKLVRGWKHALQF